MGRTRVARSGCLLAAAVVLGVEPPAVSAGQSEPATVLHPLTVARFYTITDFPDGRAAAIIAKMGRILQTDNSNLTDGNVADVECAVAFVPDGSVGTFGADNGPDVGDGDISDEDEFLRVVRQVSANVKVVPQVSWCRADDQEGGSGTSADPAGPPDVDPKNFSACAHQATRSFVVEGGLPVDVAAALWAHEFGHLQKLNGHREGQPFMVMNAEVYATSRLVDETECRAFRVPTPEP